jgi:hypothetical protein
MPRDDTEQCRVQIEVMQPSENVTRVMDAETVLRLHNFLDVSNF